MNLSEPIKVLDKGYVKYIGHMGSDESFVEAARMSTGKGFFGWYWEDDTYSDCFCNDCSTHNLLETLPMDEDGCSLCNNCWGINLAIFDHEDEHPDPKLMGKKGQMRDLALLNTLYGNRHQTPFEMGDICIEVFAPIVVFREWHRHRMQSYNEFSARYSQMPNVHYLPDPGRIQLQSKINKQGSAGAANEEWAKEIVGELNRQQQGVYSTYEAWVGGGIAKEIARLNTPVSRYSKMRAKTDVRNWLGFLSLRMAMGAQWEIRQYAHAVAEILNKLFPRTYELFLEYDLMGTGFSRTEMRVIRALISGVDPAVFKEIGVNSGLTERQMVALLKKGNEDKETIYKDAIKSP